MLFVVCTLETCIRNIQGFKVHCLPHPWSPTPLLKTFFCFLYNKLIVVFSQGEESFSPLNLVPVVGGTQWCRHDDLRFILCTIKLWKQGNSDAPSGNGSMVPCTHAMFSVFWVEQHWFHSSRKIEEFRLESHSENASWLAYMVVQQL